MTFWTNPGHQEARGHTDLVNSIEILTKEIADNNTDEQLYFLRAELYRRHANWIAALSDYDSAERYGFESEQLLFYRGQLYFESGQYEYALDLLNEFLTKNSDSPNALIIHAKIPGRKQLDSVKDIDNALTMVESPTPDLFLYRAKLLAEAGSDYFDEIINGLNYATARLGPIVSLISFGVDQCEKQKEYDQGLKIIERLPNRIKQQANWQARRGELHSLMKNPVKAREHFLAALNTIEALPNSRRYSRAIKKLEKEFRAALGADN